MAMVEALTVLAVVEAQDRATGILSGIFGNVNKLADAFKAAGAAAKTASVAQDEADKATAAANAELADSNRILAGTENAVKLAMAEVEAAEKRAADSAKLVTMANKALIATARDTGKASEATAAAQRDLTNAEEANAKAVRDVAAANDILATHMSDVATASEGVAGAQLKVSEAQDLSTAATKAQSEATSKASTATKVALGTVANAMTGVGMVTAAAAGWSAKLAGNFEQQTQVLVSGAGVQQSQLDGVRQKLLQLSTATGTSTTDMSNAFFAVKSRIADVGTAEDVMAASAETAKAHMADLTTVGKAVADTMNAYGKSAGNAYQVSNTLASAVENGGMSFQDLAGHLSTVTPIAASAGISLSQVVGAMAVMTSQGMSTAQSTNYLSHTIQHLQGPTAQMLSTWNQMGLSQSQVAKAMSGPGGLQSALNMIYDAAKSKIGPSGQVVLSVFKQSQDATQSLTTMMNNMTPAARNLAQEFQNGAIGQKAYQKAANSLGIQSGIQAQQFLSLEKKANGFNDALKAGKPGFANFDALLKASFGDSTSLNTALMLGGSVHGPKWNQFAKEAAAAGANASKHIEGWTATQQTLNFKLAQARAAASAVSIQLGTALIPVLTSIVKSITPLLTSLAQMIAHHQTMAKVAISVGLAMGVLGMALKTTLGIMNMFHDAADMFRGMKEAIQGLNVAEKLSGWFSSARTAITGAATAIKEYQIGTKLASAATAIWEGIQAAFNAVMDANPIVLIVIALVAVVAAIIYAYNHFKWFRDFVNTVWGGIVAGAKALASFFVSLWNGIVNVITTVWNGISNFFKKWWPLLLLIFATPIAILIAIWNHFHSAIMETVHVVWEGIKTFFGWIWDGIKITAQVTWMLIKLFIVGPMEAVWKALVAGWNWLSGILSAGWHKIAQAANWIWQRIKQYIVQPIQAGLNWLAGFGGMLWGHIVGAFNKVMGWLGNIGSWFLSVGSDIVNGIIQGIESGASALFSSLENLANNALKSAKSFLGIGSPSKEFAGQVGRWIPHGVAVGVTAHTQTAIDAVKKMATALPQAIGVKGAVNLGVKGLGQAGTVYGTGLGLGASAGGGTGQISLNIDLRGAVVAGDRGMEDLTNKLGNAIATRILPQAGVRFH